MYNNIITVPALSLGSKKISIRYSVNKDMAPHKVITGVMWWLMQLFGDP